MNIENATNVLFRLTSFFPSDLLVDIVADKNATADVISNTDNKTVFSIVYNDDRDNKRIITVTMQAKNKDSDARFHRYMLDISYNGNGKVYSSLVSAESYAELISVLFPCENVASEVSSSQVLKTTSYGANKMKSVYQKFESAFSNVSAYVILKDGVHVANITLKYPKDGMGRLQCFIHIHGTEMQNTFVSGCGYDKRSAAIHKTAKQYKEFIANNSDSKLKPNEAELLELLSSYEASNGWSDELYRNGFNVINVI